MKSIEIFTKEEFREWLKNHHKTEDKVQLIIHRKHTKKLSPSHKELMLEAICFGWIDTTLHKIDEDKYIRKFSKRNKNSTWSNNTQRYAKELIKENKMTEQGLKFYKEGLKKKTHDHGIPANPKMPEKLKLALNKNKKAKENFEKYPPSTKKLFYRWLLRAKREETKIKRVKIIVEKAKINNKDITISK